MVGHVCGLWFWFVNMVVFCLCLVVLGVRGAVRPMALRILFVWELYCAGRVNVRRWQELVDWVAYWQGRGEGGEG